MLGAWRGRPRGPAERGGRLGACSPGFSICAAWGPRSPRMSRSIWTTALTRGVRAPHNSRGKCRVGPRRRSWPPSGRGAEKLRGHRRPPSSRCARTARNRIGRGNRVAGSYGEELRRGRLCAGFVHGAGHRSQRRGRVSRGAYVRRAGGVNRPGREQPVRSRPLPGAPPRPRGPFHGAGSPG